MRLFVVIKTDRAVNAALGNVSSSLKLFGKGRFCGEEPYHLTLAFIGESDRVEDAKAVLEGINRPSFDIALNGLGHFGSTYYVGVSPSPSLCSLQKDVSDGLRQADFNIEDRPFTPHITLVRRYERDMEPVVFVPSVTQRVESVLLMESANGVYRTLYTKRLNA